MFFGLFRMKFPRFHLEEQRHARRLFFKRPSNPPLGADSEAEQDAMCSEISSYVVDPGWMDLIFIPASLLNPTEVWTRTQLLAEFSNKNPSVCDAVIILRPATMGLGCAETLGRDGTWCL